MGEALAADDAVRRGVNPLSLVVARRQINDHSLLIISRLYGVSRSIAAFSIMDVERVLFAALAQAPIVRSRRQSTHYKSPIRLDGGKIEAVKKLLEIVQRAENLGIVRGVSCRIIACEAPVQLVEAGSATHHELPGFHARIRHRVALVHRVVIGL